MAVSFRNFTVTNISSQVLYLVKISFEGNQGDVLESASGAAVNGVSTDLVVTTENIGGGQFLPCYDLACGVMVAPGESVNVTMPYLSQVAILQQPQANGAALSMKFDDVVNDIQDAATQAPLWIMTEGGVTCRGAFTIYSTGAAGEAALSGSGPSDARPAPAAPMIYLDTTLQKPVFYWPGDGSWRDALGNPS